MKEDLSTLTSAALASADRVERQTRLDREDFQSSKVPVPTQSRTRGSAIRVILPCWDANPCAFAHELSEYDTNTLCSLMVVGSWKHVYAHLLGGVHMLYGLVHQGQVLVGRLGALRAE